jgi:phosphate transport system permease protein
MSSTARRVRGHIIVGLLGLAVVVAVLPLVLILGTLVVKGISSLNFAFFTEIPSPAGDEGGGVAHGIVGTLMIVGVAALIAVPIGVGAGLYVAEYPTKKLAWVARFVADVLNGTPSIVVGVFVWATVVVNQKHFSGLAGSIALAVLMLPMILRTTEEMIKLVPHSLREAALALGYPRWRTSLSIVARTILPGIVTGCLLAVARAAGETAPLLFTAIGNQFFSVNMDAPMAALPLVVYSYAIGPYEEWHRLAWATALVLILVVFALSVSARLATRRRDVDRY